MRVPLAKISVGESRLRNHRNFRKPLVFISSGVGLLLAFFLDGFVERLIASGINPELSKFAQLISHASDWPALIAVLLCVGASFWKFHKPAKARFVVIMGISAILAGASATGIRSLTGRTRPDAQEQQGFYGVWHNDHLLIGRRDYNSFPSGHTATVAGIAGVLLFARRRLAIAAFFYVGVLGWARIALSCHHFSDVVASVLVGIAAGSFTWQYIAPKIIGTRAARAQDKSEPVTMPPLAPAVNGR